MNYFEKYEKIKRAKTITPINSFWSYWDKSSNNFGYLIVGFSFDFKDSLRLKAETLRNRTFDLTGLGVFVYFKHESFLECIRDHGLTRLY